MGTFEGEARLFNPSLFVLFGYLNSYIYYLFKKLKEIFKNLLLFHLVIKDYFSGLYLSYSSVTIYSDRTMHLASFLHKNGCFVSFRMSSFNLKLPSSKEYLTFLIVVCLAPNTETGMRHPNKCLLNERMSHTDPHFLFLSLPNPLEQFLVAKPLLVDQISLSP